MAKASTQPLTAEEFLALSIPDARTELLRSPTDVRILGPGDALTGEDLLPGFSCPVAAFF